MPDLAGSVVVITGATRGIGRALAELCRARGAHVVGGGHEDGARVLLAAALRAHGRVEVWINNAGVAVGEGEEILAVNLTGAYLGARAAIDWATAAGRPLRVVNVSSVATDAPPAGAVAYVASKHGLEGLTRALARDAEGTDVVVTAVKLGPHRTDLTRALLPAAEWAALPPAEDAAAQILAAVHAPGPLVAGRVLAGARLVDEPLVEALVNQPLGRLPEVFAADPPPENPWGASPVATAALAGARLDRYPEATQRELRQAIAARHGVSVDHVAVGAGITELLERALRLFVRPGEPVATADPTWPYFAELCRRYGAVRRRLTASVQARLVYLASPSVPSGQRVDLDTLRGLVRPERTLVVDEAYAEYADPTAAQAISLVAETDARVIVLRTFSKIHGLAGVRVGYAVATAQVVRLLERAAPPFVVSTPSAAAALGALSDEAHVHAAYAANRQERARMQARLAAAGVSFLPSETPFFLCHANGRHRLLHVGMPEDNDRELERVTAWAKSTT